MSRPSWRMGGGKMEIELDSGRGRSVGSHIQLKGRAFGISFGVDEIVTERNPPRRKVWETTDSPKLLVIGHYRMGPEIAPSESASALRLFIDYALPDKPPARWYRTFIFLTVATENSQCAEKSGVFEFADAISTACLSSCDRSSLGLYADSVVERLWN